MKYKIKNDQIAYYNEINPYQFPKYTSQLINWANQNAQGTRPKVVGQMSDIFPQFISESDDISVNSWKEWYMHNYPDAINTATNKIFDQIQNLKKAIPLIDKEMVKRWVEDLVFFKTYNGLYVQKAILAFLAEKKEQSYALANAEDESKGIDGYVGDVPYSIKSISYKTMKRLSESIDVKMIYYEKTKSGLKIEVEE